MEIQIRSIQEHDLDLFLVEECSSNPPFLQWLIHKVYGEDFDVGELTEIGNSTNTPTGESDVEIWFLDKSGEKHCVLVEHKITAPNQPQQSERYIQRGNNYLEQGRCVEFRTVLIAPQAYLEGYKGKMSYQKMIEYELIKDWLNQHYSDQGRLDYKNTLMDQAITKSKAGYQPIIDSVATEFWRDYWNLINEMAPELEMNEPGPKPAGSGFIYFHPINLPKAVGLVHKLPHGNVDLQFERKGEIRMSFERLVKPSLSRGMSVTKAGESCCIRIKVEPVNWMEPLQSQEKQIREGIEAAKEFVVWADNNMTVVQKAADL